METQGRTASTGSLTAPRGKSARVDTAPTLLSAASTGVALPVQRGSAGQFNHLLPPCAATVAALAESLGGACGSVAMRDLLLSDPGTLIAYLGMLPRHSSAQELVLPQSGDQDSLWLLWSTLERAGAADFADWTMPPACEVYRVSQRIAQLARRLATLASMPLDAAQVAGMLAPLGALALHFHGGGAAGSADYAALTRSLARELPLPGWLANTLLSLDLATPLPASSLDDRIVPGVRRDEASNRSNVRRQGRQHPNAIAPSDDQLVWIVQAAIGLVKYETAMQFLPTPGNTPSEALARLGLTPECGATVVSDLEHSNVAVPVLVTPSLVWRLARRLAGPRATSMAAALTSAVEAEQLRGQLAVLQETERDRLRDMKMRALAEFAAGAGHEINNPLAVISGQAQHLLKSEENLERARGLERIVSQCRRIHLLLRDVMLYARPPQLRLRRFSPHRLIQRVVAELQGYALERRINLRNDADGKQQAPRRTRTRSTTLQARGDVALLRTALSCLVRNAVEAAPADGWARVRLEQGHDTVAVIVEDNGPGLAPQWREHLFDPFFSQRTAGRGSGLGLCKAWRVAELHGGSLDVSAEPGHPTRFILILPRLQAAIRSLRQAAAARRSPPRSRRRADRSRSS